MHEDLQKLDTYIQDSLIILSKLLISKEDLSRDILHSLFSQLLDVRDQLDDLSNNEGDE